MLFVEGCTTVPSAPSRQSLHSFQTVIFSVMDPIHVILLQHADDLVVDSPDGVLEVEGLVESAEDGDIGWVGAIGGFVFLSHGGHKIIE